MSKILWILSACMVAAGLGWGWSRFGPGLARWYEAARYPPIRQRPPYSDEMERRLRAEAQRRTMRRYQSVLARLDQAQARGHDVRALRAKLPRVLKLIRQDEHRLALVQLNSIELRIPRSRRPVRSAGGEDFSQETLFPEVIGEPQSPPPSRRPSGRRR